MATVSDSIPHLVRTSNDPRQEGLHFVTVSKVHEVNSSVRLIRLQLADGGPIFAHLPGQWLDVHIPSIPQAGGFTITSAPQHGKQDRYLELAIKESPNNPPAAFFFRPETVILGTQLQVRVGGRFVFPPPDLAENEVRDINRIVFIAGGMGINPIMSMLEHLHLESHLRAGGGIRALKLLYGTRAKQGEAILFYERIARILGEYMSGVPGVALGKDVGYGAYIYATFCSQWNPKKVPMYEKLETDHLKHNKGHIRLRDALDALGPRVDRKNTVAYICGPPKMTDVFVERLSTAEGMDPKRVLCEKWW